MVTTHGWQVRYATCERVKSAAMQLCRGCIASNYLTTLGRAGRKSTNFK